jgi:hypothetical protein
VNGDDGRYENGFGRPDDEPLSKDQLGQSWLMGGWRERLNPASKTSSKKRETISEGSGRRRLNFLGHKKSQRPTNFVSFDKPFRK